MERNGRRVFILVVISLHKGLVYSSYIITLINIITIIIMIILMIMVIRHSICIATNTATKYSIATAITRDRQRVVRYG